MSQENMEIVRAAIDAYNRGDLDSFLEYAAPDFEADWSRAVGPDHGVYGRDQWRRFLGDFGASWESVWLEPQGFIDAGERVVSPLTVHMVGRNGIEVQARPTWTFTIRDGAIEHIRLYQEREEALVKAAGGRE